MASRIRLKWGGAGWYGPIGDGNLRLKWGGSSWFIPSLVYVKTSDGAANGTAAVTNGGYGANPRWVDSGYRGAPGTPSTPAVYSWPSYSYMTIYCHGSTVGAPAVSFDLLQMDSSGNWIAAEWGSVDTIAGFYTNPGARYIYVARATSATGLVSGWSGQLRVQMGYSGSPIYGWTKSTSGWYAQVDGSWGRDNPAWMEVPVHVTIQNFHYSFDAPAGGGWCSPAPNRYLHNIFFSTTDGEVMTLPSPVWYVDYLPGRRGDLIRPGTTWSPQVWEDGIWGGGHLWGVVPRGSGWGWYGHPDGNYYLLNGAFGIEGTAHYDVWAVVAYTADAPNTYW